MPNQKKIIMTDKNGTPIEVGDLVDIGVHVAGKVDNIVMRISFINDENNQFVLCSSKGDTDDTLSVKVSKDKITKYVSPEEKLEMMGL